MHRAKSVLAKIRDRFSRGPALPFLDEVLIEADRLRAHWGDNPEQWDGVLVCKEDDEEGEPEEGLSKKEADKLKKAIAKKDREVRDAEKKAGEQDDRISELERKLEAESGDDDKSKASERKLDELEKRVEKAEAKAESEGEKRVEAERQTTAVDVATRLKFRNPKRAIKQLDSDDLDDEDSIEEALERLAREEPYMVSTKKQRPVDDDKPKPKKPDKKKGDNEEEESTKKGDEEPVGKARIKAAYDEAEDKGADDDGGDDGGSDD